MSGPAPTPTYVADAAAIEALARRLEGEPRVALDTESNSFHAYRERVCLMQISIAGADFIVDPIAVDVRPLGAVLGGSGNWSSTAPTTTCAACGASSDGTWGGSSTP